MMDIIRKSEKEEEVAVPDEDDKCIKSQSKAAKKPSKKKNKAQVKNISKPIVE